MKLAKSLITLCILTSCFFVPSANTSNAADAVKGKIIFGVHEEECKNGTKKSILISAEKVSDLAGFEISFKCNSDDFSIGSGLSLVNDISKFKNEIKGTNEYRFASSFTSTVDTSSSYIDLFELSITPRKNFSKISEKINCTDDDVIKNFYDDVFVIKLSNSKGEPISYEFSFDDYILGGDFDGNDIINLKDAMYLNLYLNSKYTIDEKYLKKADVNRDGIINVDDVRCIQKKVIS